MKLYCIILYVLQSKLTVAGELRVILIPVFIGKVFFIIPNDNFCFLSGCSFSLPSSPSTKEASNILIYYLRCTEWNIQIPFAEFSISFDNRFDIVKYGLTKIYEYYTLTENNIK